MATNDGYKDWNSLLKSFVTWMRSTRFLPTDPGKWLRNTLKSWRRELKRIGLCLKLFTPLLFWPIFMLSVALSGLQGSLFLMIMMMRKICQRIRLLQVENLLTEMTSQSWGQHPKYKQLQGNQQFTTKMIFIPRVSISSVTRMETVLSQLGSTLIPSQSWLVLELDKTRLLLILIQDLLPMKPALK